MDVRISESLWSQPSGVLRYKAPADNQRSMIVSRLLAVTAKLK
jgi:hypothetical protein